MIYFCKNLRSRINARAPGVRFSVRLISNSEALQNVNVDKSLIEKDHFLRIIHVFNTDYCFCSRAVCSERRAVARLSEASENVTQNIEYGEDAILQTTRFEPGLRRKRF